MGETNFYTPHHTVLGVTDHVPSAAARDRLAEVMQPKRWVTLWTHAYRCALQETDTSQVRCTSWRRQLYQFSEQVLQPGAAEGLWRVHCGNSSKLGERNCTLIKRTACSVDKRLCGRSSEEESDRSAPTLLAEWRSPSYPEVAHACVDTHFLKLLARIRWSLSRHSEITVLKVL